MKVTPHLAQKLLSLVLSLVFSRTTGFGSSAARAASENVPVMQKTIQHGGDGGAIAEELSTVFNGSVCCNQRAGSLIASHNDFQQFLGGGQRQLAHSQIINDEKRHGGEQFHVFLAVSSVASVNSSSRMCASRYNTR